MQLPKDLKDEIITYPLSVAYRKIICLVCSQRVTCGIIDGLLKNKMEHRIETSCLDDVLKTWDTLTTEDLHTKCIQG